MIYMQIAQCRWELSLRKTPKLFLQLNTAMVDAHTTKTMDGWWKTGEKV